MRNSIKGLFVGLAALMAMAFAVSTASAVTVAPGGNITATSLGTLGLQSDIVTLNCNVTLNGSIATSGTVGSRVGSISGGSATGCESGFTVDLLLGTAWPLRLISTAGSPITSALMNIENVGFQVNFLGSPVCLFAGTVGFNYTEGGLIVVLANTLTGDCGSGSLRTGSQFRLSPAQNIS